LHTKADELPLFTTGSDHNSTQQVVFFHQPVHLLFVNVKAIRLQVFCDLHIPGKEHELFCEHKANANYHTLIADAASICKTGMRRRLTTSFATVRMIVVGAVGQAAPLQKPSDFPLSFKELNDGAFLLDT
jgi:hypothetical protein